MSTTRETGLPFMKMHGLGNDFVVFDGRPRKIEITPALARAVGDRHRGIGYDQLALIETGEGDAHLSFWNADGSVAQACGNATRCIARYLLDETGKDRLHLTTIRGDLYAVDVGGGRTSVNMGAPMTDWRDIPLSEEMDTLELPIEGAPTATSMGNPHCTFFVEHAEAIPLDTFGPRYEHHPLFPERTNVQVASVIAPDHLRMRVWERGVGVTLASGSSSCATAVSAARRGLTGRKVRMDLDGGTLEIDWRDDGVWMTGETMHVADGVFRPEFLDRVE
ncbi:diaminopimelate epimerase [Roseovarius sp. SCSIO 43702]|uniref:diaminopimelate epimerase n=1 Tax=Roseovarius sp. SCSIO 43702 TaxID=2823043 RepID=UPI001C72E5A9|nr:diaminopimelate epimerase [Roseovarius sp. SCSIO 43702]QYX57673.1 diaminopimelate epimerase [Roseovarius sp. SCSIO 43702]